MNRNRSKNKKGRKRIGRICSMLFVLLFVFAGCSAGNGQETVATEHREDAGTRIFYLNEEKTKVVAETLEMIAGTPEERISFLLSKLEENLWTDAELENIQEKNPILGYELQENGNVVLQFASDYHAAEDITTVLRRAAIVKTLCQLAEVQTVEIYIGTQPLMHFNGKPVGRMRADDFVDSTGIKAEFLQDTYISVYFADETGEKLVESRLLVTYDGKISEETLVIEQLLQGPVTEGTQAVLPKGTVLNRISIKDGICYVDLNETFLELREGISAEATLYAVVNSLAELDKVYKVCFLINGEQRSTFHGMEFNQPFERNLDIVEGEQ